MSLSILSKKSTQLIKLVNKLNENGILPERLKGGRIERIIDYGKHVLRDYQQAIKDTINDSKSNQKKSTFYFSLIGLLTYLYKTNPSSNSYKDELLNYQNIMNIIGEPIRNPNCYNYLYELNNLDNQKRLFRLDLIFFTVFINKEFNSDLKIYEANCNYLQPSYLDYLTNRIVDIGIANKWIFLNKNLKDFDINPSEFKE